MPDKATLRRHVRSNLDGIMLKVNSALRGEGVDALEPVLARLNRSGQLPHWYPGLKATRSLPNLDGKTVGSVVEMIFVSVLETDALVTFKLPPLKINPARGVDLPDLDLGIKSPSENYCTSEPFFSAYERLIGSEYDALVMLTDYQDAKKNPPLRLQIINWSYLAKTQIADAGLCRIAKLHRDWLLQTNEAWAKKVCRFLAYVNQSDWKAKKLLQLLAILQDESQVHSFIQQSESDFKTKNLRSAILDKPLLPQRDIDSLLQIRKISPLHLGIIDAADNWVVETQKDFGRFPSENEWVRYVASPLDGSIGMSFALQWRYNFGKLFGFASSD